MDRANSLTSPVGKMKPSEPTSCAFPRAVEAITGTSSESASMIDRARPSRVLGKTNAVAVATYGRTSSTKPGTRTLARRRAVAPARVSDRTPGRHRRRPPTPDRCLADERRRHVSRALVRVHLSYEHEHRGIGRYAQSSSDPLSGSDLEPSTREVVGVDLPLERSYSLRRSSRLHIRSAQ